MRIAKSIGIVVLAVGALSACGGGGSEAGDVGAMSVLPTQMKITYAPNCYAPGEYIDTEHVINGGQPPFRIRSSQPDVFEFGRHQTVNGVRTFVPLGVRSDGVVEIDGKDPHFVVRTKFIGLCVDPATIVVLDLHSNTVVVTYAITAPSAATPTPTP